MKLVKYLESKIESGKRILKTLGLGKNDVQTSQQALPYGIDSQPIANVKVIRTSTGDYNVSVILGCINVNQQAAIGELRLFSTDENGEEQCFAHFKNDGKILINGDDDNMVRYSKLEEAFNELKGDFNAFANAYIPGGPTVVGSPAEVLPSTADISGAKIADIYTNSVD